MYLAVKIEIFFHFNSKISRSYQYFIRLRVNNFKKKFFIKLVIYFDGAVLHRMTIFEFVIFEAKIAKTLLWNEINKPSFLYKYFYSKKK